MLSTNQTDLFAAPADRPEPGPIEPRLVRAQAGGEYERGFVLFTDPGHAWLRVPRALLRELGILDRITPYSYQRGQDVFLEEDCDLTTFVHAMGRAGRVVFYFETTGSIAQRESAVRSYSSFTL